MTQRNKSLPDAPAVAIGYTRVSTRTQVESGHGLEMQERTLRSWSTFEGVGVPLSRIAHDDAMSGSSMEDRVELQEALFDVIHGGPGSTFVVYKLDRLGRSSVDVQETIDMLLDAGVRVVSIADGIDTRNEMGKMILKLLTNILATFAEIEKEAIVGRLQGGRKLAKEQKRANTRYACYGERKVTVVEAGKEIKRLVPHDDEIAILGQIRSLAADGLGFNAIAETLNAAGVPARGRRWWATTVRRVLTGKRSTPAPKRSKRIERARDQVVQAHRARAEAYATKEEASS